MALLPELAVQSTFVTAGLHFGFILYLQQANYEPQNGRLSPLLAPLVAGPLLLSVLAALVTATLLFVIKRRSRMEQFRQPTLLIVAALCFVVSAVPYLFEEYFPLHIVATYAAGVAHGITYIAGISFVNMRVSSRCRSSRLALCHFCYLLGFAIAAQILCQPYGWLRDYGLAQLLSGGFSLVLLCGNEVFQFFAVYDYRHSLDEDLDRVNVDRVLLYDRKEIVDTLRANAARFPDTVMVVSEVKRRWKLTALLVLLKGHGFMLVVPTLRDQLQAVLVAPRFWLMHWMAVAGVAVAVLLLLFFSAKRVYLLFASLTALSLFATLFLPPVAGGELMAVWMYYGFLSLLYVTADIAIVDTTVFARTEVNVCAAFALEKLLLTVFLFVKFYDPNALSASISGTERSIWQAYAIVFLVYCGLMLVLVTYVYPNTRGKSLYRIRKQMMGIRMEKRRTPEEMADEADQNTVHAVLPPPLQYGYNSATGTYDFPKKAPTPISPLAMPVWNTGASATGLQRTVTASNVSPTTPTSPLAMPVWNMAASATGVQRTAPTSNVSPTTPTTAMPAWNNTTSPLPTRGNRMSPAGSSGAAPTVFFTGGMDNRYDRDFQRMAPSHVMPRALIGGAIFTSIAWSM